MSVLDEMTAATRTQKEDKGATLTPVGMEAGGPFGKPRIPDVPEVFLTQEAVLDIAQDIRRMVGVLLDVALGLEKHAGREAALDTGETIAVPDVKAQERAADESFAEKFSAMQADAQAATFAANDAPAPEAEAPVRVSAGSAGIGEGWTCPEHGDADLKDLTSRRGRKYRACNTCTQFEK